MLCGERVAEHNSREPAGSKCKPIEQMQGQRQCKQTHCTGEERFTPGIYPPRADDETPVACKVGEGRRVGARGRSARRGGAVGARGRASGRGEAGARGRGWAVCAAPSAMRAPPPKPNEPPVIQKGYRGWEFDVLLVWIYVPNHQSATAIAVITNRPAMISANPQPRRPPRSLGGRVGRHTCPSQRSHCPLKGSNAHQIP